MTYEGSASIDMTSVMGRTITYDGVGVGSGLGELVCEGMLLFLKKKLSQ